VKLEKRGEFPKRVRLGPNSVGWIESEIDDWLAKRQRVAA
jgi:prophage regulatory protein